MTTRLQADKKYAFSTMCRVWPKVLLFVLVDRSVLKLGSWNADTGIFMYTAWHNCRS